MKGYESLPIFLTEDELVKFWIRYFQEHPDEVPHVQLYIHYPWCMSLCNFCVFGQCKYKDYKDIIPDYEKAMIRQISKLNKLFDVIIPDEMYLGGGTASLWSRDFLRELKGTLGVYDKIKWKQTEIHPMDLNQKKVQLYADELGFDRVSIGVQSFGRESNLKQNRIPANLDTLVSCIRDFQRSGVFVNIDLVALFGLKGEWGWSEFQKDLEIAATTVRPDSMFVEPNFRATDFYYISFRFRRILMEFLKQHPEYRITNSQALELSYESIIKYRDLPYELVRGSDHSQISRDEFISERKKEVIIGLGGIGNFTAYSKTPNDFYIDAKYIPHDKEFVYTLTRHKKFEGIDPVDENDLYNTKVQVGNYTIPPPRRLS